MDYRYLGRTGVKVSAACMGSMTFGREIGEDDSFAILDRFKAEGGNFIDTADNIYSDGKSEEIVGSWLKKQSNRSQWVLATKVCFPTGHAPTDVGLSRKHIYDALDASLKRLQTDYVDLYQVHWWDNGTPIEETMRALNDIVTSGKARYIGCSNFAAWHIVQANAIADAHGWARFATLQPMYSLLVREADVEQLPVCREQGMAVLPYSPLARGAVTGKHGPEEVAVPATTAGLGKLGGDEWNRLRHAYETERKQRIVEVVKDLAETHRRTPAQIALAWVSAQKPVAAPILGARTVSQLEDNLGFISLALSAEDLKRLGDVSQPRYPYPHDYIGWANGEYKR